MRTSKKTLETYKAEAVEYRMYFGKAHEHEVDWLRKYIVKNPDYLPVDIISKEEFDDTIIRPRLRSMDKYVEWATSGKVHDGIPKELQVLIEKSFSLL